MHVVFVSDGAMSHPNSRRYGRRTRVELREREATAACVELGVEPGNITFLRYPDTEVPRRHHPGFESATRRIRKMIECIDASHVLVPWRRDPHCDHRATWELCRAACAELPRPPKWIEYPIWMWNTDKPEEMPHPGEVISWRLDVSTVAAVKERAINHHVSQLTRLIDDDPDGFILNERMLAHFRRSTELYFEDTSKKSASLDGGYFDGVYAVSDDPWSFASSEYESAKYRHSLAALTRPVYHNAFEIGCSIGVLTSLLAPRCAKLLAVDIAEKPLQIARRRLHGEPRVRFARMTLPTEFPEEAFDLIVCSEVGYYWSETDLEIAVAKIGKALLPGGQLLLVHFTPYVPDYPLTGDEVHAAFKKGLGRKFTRLRSDRAERYRLDLYQKRGDATNS